MKIFWLTCEGDKKRDRVVLIIYANEHVIDGAMCKQLIGKELQMSEVVHSKTK